MLNVYQKNILDIYQYCTLYMGKGWHEKKKYRKKSNKKAKKPRNKYIEMKKAGKLVKTIERNEEK